MTPSQNQDRTSSAPDSADSDDTAESPYLSALGPGANGLHPRLLQYFSAVPHGSVGVGRGRFTHIGARRRWLTLALRPLHKRGAIFAGWRRDVRFTVVNRTRRGAAIAERTLHLPDGDWTMRDEVTARPGSTVVDVIGSPPALAAAFEVAARDRALTLRSTAVSVRIGALRLRIPNFIAPVIRLRESFDEQDERQHVKLTVDAPLIGRVYEYRGEFTYDLEPERSTA